MRLHRFLGQFNLEQESLMIEDVDLVHQIRKVFRFTTSDKFILSDGNSNEAIVEISEGGGKNSISVKILEKFKNENEPALKVTLYCAILKRENFELAVQKAIETGASEIIPIISERTVKTGLNIDRVKKIIMEAAEQSGRGIIPFLNEPLNFEEALTHAKRNTLNVLFDPTGSDTRNQILDINIGIFIGPEGGFTEKEIELAKQNNFEIRSLGKLILRAETAVIVGTYLAVHG